jgi:hypothetical protein
VASRFRGRTRNIRVRRERTPRFSRAPLRLHDRVRRAPPVGRVVRRRVVRRSDRVVRVAVQFETGDDVFLDLPEERTRRCPPPPPRRLVRREVPRARCTRCTRQVGSVQQVLRSRGDRQGRRDRRRGAGDTRSDARDGEGKVSSSTAVWPRGPILLPGSMAVVEGRQGHAFAVREYEEVLVPSFVEGVLPRTVSAPPPRMAAGDGRGSSTRTTAHRACPAFREGGS